MSQKSVCLIAPMNEAVRSSQTLRNIYKTMCPASQKTAIFIPVAVQTSNLYRSQNISKLSWAILDMIKLKTNTCVYLNVARYVSKRYINIDYDIGLLTKLTTK